MNKIPYVNNASEIIKVLESLEEQLKDSKLKKLRAFNTAYLIISRNIDKKNKDGYFEYPKLLENLDVNFVNYYLAAINNFYDQKPVANLWKIAFKTTNKNPLINLYLGANAHINDDLPLSLNETINTKAFYSDYQKAEVIIFKSLDEIINSIFKTPPNIFLKTFYKTIMKFLIKRWRKNAWNKSNIQDQIRATRS
ncbi:MAG TPA: DUF5995 family protein [Patescibacteria group bacterium]|nr:DUF5995 family protein [Patescibacteria group bacterium]